MSTNRPSPPSDCPVCGEPVPPRSLACPACGADEKTGWNEESGGSLDLPDDSFDYDSYVKREFGGAPPAGAIHPVWWVTAVVLLVALVWWLVL